MSSPLYYISQISENNPGSVVKLHTCNSLKEVADLCLSYTTAPAKYNYLKRSINTTDSIKLIFLDFDGTATLDELQFACLNYRHIIMETRSSVPGNERYRVVLVLENDITNDADYKECFNLLKESFPGADPACKDISRMFYKHKSIIQIEEEGDTFRFIPSFKETITEVKIVPAPIDTTEKGELTKLTLDFLLFGAPAGEWHHRMFKALLNMKEQNYTQEEATEMLQKMCETSQHAIGELDKTDLKRIEDVYLNRETKHDFQPKLFNEEPKELIVKADSLIQDMFSYLIDDTKVSGKATGFSGLDELLGGGFREGELIGLLAKTKNGKSTLVHHLIKNNIDNGYKVAYASQELTASTEALPNIVSIHLNKNLWKQKPTQNDLEKIKEYVGNNKLSFSPTRGYFPVNKLIEWTVELSNQGYTHFYLDHMLFALEDSEDYKEAAKLMRIIKDLTTKLNIIFFVVIQPKGLMDGMPLNHNAIRGGSSVAQIVDVLLILERQHNTEQSNIARLKLELGRHKLARPGDIYIQYQNETTGFIEVEEEAQETQTTPDPLQQQLKRDYYRSGIKAPSPSYKRSWEEVN